MRRTLLGPGKAAEGGTGNLIRVLILRLVSRCQALQHAQYGLENGSITAPTMEKCSSFEGRCNVAEDGALFGFGELAGCKLRADTPTRLLVRRSGP